MMETLADDLREQGRGITGGLLLVGLSFVYTMETWWVAWQLPVTTLMAYALLGLGGVLVVTQQIGYRRDVEDDTTDSKRTLAVDFFALVVQSFVAAYGTLFLFGILEIGDSLPVIARMGLVQVVPLGLGAAMANELLGGTDSTMAEADFPFNLPVFALGAVFFTAPLAPTDEMQVVAMETGWLRLAVVVVVSVVLVFSALYQLDFRDQQARVQDRTLIDQVSSAFIVYLVGVVVSVTLLFVFGQFIEASLAEAVQLIVVLSFPGSIGAAAGEVVL